MGDCRLRSPLTANILACKWSMPGNWWWVTGLTCLPDHLWGKLVVIVKNCVKWLIWLLIGCARLNNQ